MTRTYVILDALQDPGQGQDLSVRWAQAGFDNALDVAGQCAWLSPKSVSHNGGDATANSLGNAGRLGETDLDRANGIARAFGLEIRDRIGRVFRPDNDLGAMRRHVVHEYKGRLATALVFGVPALVLHYVGGELSGEAGDARSMIFPWVFELLLVGWSCIAAGWPILRQGVLAAFHLRATADLLTTLIVVGAYVPSAVGVIAIIWVDEPWLSPRPGAGPMIYAANIAITLSVFQRWLIHRAAHRMSGKATLMIRHFSRLVAVWLIVSTLVMLIGGWELGLAIALIFPPAIGLGAINRWSPGIATALPVFAFAAFVLVGPGALAINVEGLRIEIAALFVAMEIMVMSGGWRRFAPVEP